MMRSPLSESERYDSVDLPFYRAEVAPILPAQVLDFHTHIWRRDHWKELPWESGRAGGKYMVTPEDYGVEQLLSDGKALFPDRPYHAVCFGQPIPVIDLEKANAYSADAGRRPGLFPLLVAGRGTAPVEALGNRVREGGFFGYKVYVNWQGNDYGAVKVEDMIGPEEMAVADEMGLVVLLHVPAAGRLADPEVQKGVRKCAAGYPNANIVLAHCGRCYLPDEMRAAIGAIADLDNVYLDTSMVMDPLVMQIVFDQVDSRRVVFATDLPVARMRGRRVYVMDHWVDVVLEGYPASAYRVMSDGIRATFMAWEIVLAIKRAAEVCGLSRAQLQGVFYENGMALLRQVMGGRQL